MLIFLPDSSAATKGAAQAAELALGLPNSRTAENEADRLGMILATKAGYTPQSAITLWEKMGSVGGGARPPEFLSTHPSPSNRKARLAELAGEMQDVNPQGKKASIHKVRIILES